MFQSCIQRKDKKSSNAEPKGILFIDMQCFNIPALTPKEISFTYDGINIYNYLILPKENYQLLCRKTQHTIRWLENNYHGISYNSGYIKYDNIHEIFELHDADLVIVKGSQKIDFLQTYYKNIINVEFQINCPKFEKQLNRTCFYHNKLNVPYVMCSKTNVKSLYNYVQENKHIFKF